MLRLLSVWQHSAALAVCHALTCSACERMPSLLLSAVLYSVSRTRYNPAVPGLACRFAAQGGYSWSFSAATASGRYAGPSLLQRLSIAIWPCPFIVSAATYVHVWLGKYSYE